MFLKKIELENFRNYSSCEIDFHEKINIITGENAQGKTNLLESIYFSSFIRSFRTSSDKEMISFGKDHLRVCSSYSKNGEIDLVEVAMDRSGRKIAKINGARQERLRDVVSDYYVVVFSPEDMKIVKEEPERRRNFLDREICQMSLSYFESLAVYKKLLLQRNSYLKDEKIDEALKYTDLVMLDIKHIDNEEHKRLTGKGNRNILAFAEHIRELGIPVWIRHVVVPGITDKYEELFALGEFLSTLSNIKALDVLPYHDMAKPKYAELGLDYPLGDTPPLTKEEAIKARDIIMDGIKSGLRKQK